MALRFSFFKIPEHKRFEYIPRYWNPEKEEREARLKRIQEEMGATGSSSDGKPYVPNIRGSFRREFDRTRKSKSGTKGMMKIRSLIMIVSVLLFVVIFVFLLKIFPWLFVENEQNKIKQQQIEIIE
ncbi:MAG: hypothetical protein LBD59_05350 [Prevotellaceae bacterium]|jgi:hypothetical protein|nr:hypothetical protein [Prevotellaceae bacterium]